MPTHPVLRTAAQAAIALSLGDDPAPKLRVQQLLLDCFNAEVRERRCGECGHEHASAKLMPLKPPRNLILHLKRFDTEPTSGRTQSVTRASSSSSRSISAPRPEVATTCARL